MVKKRRNSTGSVCISDSAQSTNGLSPSVSTSTQERTSVRSQPSHRSSKRTDSSIWLLFLILSGLNPKSQFDPHYLQIDTKMDGHTANMRTLFDPMVGSFCADTSPQVLDAFFNSKIRWRNDQELAQFAWNQNPIQVNMMMTQQAPIIRGTTAANSSTVPQRAALDNGQPTDPSLIDYDAIDRYWRHDIELEKGPAIGLNPIHYNSNGQGCSSTPERMIDVSAEQFERDLQLLKEKQMLQPLTHEETFRYENLSKCHYADFYRVVPSAASKRWESAATSTSTSGYSDVSEQYRPTSPSKSNISNFDEKEAADFFSNLAKQSLLEEMNSVNVEPQPQLQTYSNLTLCADQSALVNNVSMIQSMPNETFDGLYTNCNAQSTGGLRGSGIEKGKQENTPVLGAEEEELFASLDYDPPIPIPEEEANAAMQNLQYNEDLDEALQLREFMSMEMLGEFQNSNSIANKRVDSPIPQSLLTVLPQRETSPSSGIGSMQSSSSSPNYFDENSDNNEDGYGFRYDNKLAPKMYHQFENLAGGDKFHSARKDVKSRTSMVVDGGVEQRKRGRQSKDEQLAQDHQLPATAEEFAAMSHMDIQAFMRDPTLTQAQKTLIKKIRRRRNKLAARKCRERRFNDATSTFDGN
ncbi:BZIP domain-containing protein [Aphelenchoides besseyi]|nr:BZIP domain-containing protein [Aphelenchoides besseyi]KAI6200370.1 BZIP domain-containing protein [Aphelenchoides besseyi]